MLGFNLPDLDWHNLGRCFTGKHDPNLWISAKGGSGITAKKICNTQCPVKAKCLAWITDIENTEGMQAGIYGGLSPRERLDLKRSSHNKPARRGQHSPTSIKERQDHG